MVYKFSHNKTTKFIEEVSFFQNSSCNTLQKAVYYAK